MRSLLSQLKQAFPAAGHHAAIPELPAIIGMSCIATGRFRDFGVERG